MPWPKRIGVDDSTMYRIESGHIRQPSTELLGRLADALGLEVTDVLRKAGIRVDANQQNPVPIYFRQKYRDLPPPARRELKRFMDYLSARYPVDHDGPADGEDELEQTTTTLTFKKGGPNMNNTITSETSIFARLRGLVPQRLLRLSEAERLAELQANRFRELMEIAGPELPVEAITELPRLLVTVDTLMPVSGSAYWSTGRWVISLNAQEHPARQRFSLAHELKHVLDHTTKHWLYPEEPGLPASVKSERVADYFAGCLLMPKRHVKRLYGQHPGDIDRLAEAFFVTPRAVRFRLDQLGVTDPTPRCGTPNRMLQPATTRSRRLVTTPVVARRAAA